MPSSWIGPHLFPVITALFLPFSFITTYIIAVCLDHVEPGFPYISDTGAIPPESCVFGQLLSIGAIFVGICIYIRWRQICQYCDDFGVFHPDIRRINMAAFVIGLVASCGISVVGNFQETNVLVMHLVGAILAFGLGNVYAWLQVYLSFRVCPTIGRLWICRLRLFFSLVSTAGFVTTLVAEHFAKLEYKGKDPKKWLPDDGGFDLHIVSTASEWAMSIFFCLYFTTFTCEFNRFKIQHMDILTEPDDQMDMDQDARPLNI